MIKRGLFLLLLAMSLGAARAGDIRSVLVHPIFKGVYSCSEHWADQLPYVGDALGTDCFIQKLVEVKGRTWLRAYKGDGRNNKDWYVWQQDVLSPCDCEVVKININPVVNQPGIMGKGPASYVLLKQADGIMFTLAHIDKPKVQVGDSVKAGQAIAQVGNNGYARHPHIHIGAWQGDEPLQLRFDQNHMGEAESNNEESAPNKSLQPTALPLPRQAGG